MGDVVTIGRPVGFDRSIRLMTKDEVEIFDQKETQQQLEDFRSGSKIKLRTTLQLLKIALGPTEAALVLEEVVSDVFRKDK